ncbi:MAG: hypothetical protein WBA99_15205 [Nodosilinea sp.]
MGLTQDLTNLVAQTAAQMPQDAKAQMTAAAAALANSGILAQSLNVGDKIPDVTLPNPMNQWISLPTFLKTGPLVISFYRGGWCPYLLPT